MFKEEPEKLAEFLAANPGLYNAGADFLNTLKGRGILSSELEESLSKDLETFRAAHDIATNAGWFAFEVYDSWADRTDQIYAGVELYQKVNRILVPRIVVGSNGAPEIDRAITLLRNNKIELIYTRHIPPEGYCGLVQRFEDADGDYLERKVLEPASIEEFKQAGIEVEILNVI